MNKVLSIAYSWLIGCMIVAPQVQAQSFDIDFAEDTAYACLNTHIALIAAPTGGLAPYSYQWSNGQIGDSIAFLAQQASEWLILSVTDANGDQGLDSVLIISFDECVWPGDADGSGLANNLDLLTVGQLFNHVGPKRPHAHANWIGQTAPAWNASLPGGVNAVHSDTDGDGIVHWADVPAIKSNYLQPQSLGNSANLPGGIPVFLNFPGGPFNPGDTVIGEIIVGDANHPVYNLMGLALSIAYDSNLIASSSISVDFGASWLGSKDVNLAGLEKNFANHALVDIGLVRTDLLAQNGYGSVGNIIVAIDDITGKRADLLQTELRVSHITLLAGNGAYLDVDNEVVPFEISMSGEQLRDLFDIKVSFNTASDYLQIEKKGGLRGPIEINLNNMAGQMVFKDSWYYHSRKQINTGSLPTGIYLLSFKHKQQIYTQKIHIP